MKWRIRFLRLLKVVLSLVVLYSICWYFFWRGPVAHSDVPVTAEMGWWSYQDGLKVTEFTAEAVDPRLNLFENQFVMRFRIKGTIQLNEMNGGWRPRIREVQITGRVISRSYSADWVPPNVPPETKADVLVVPIISAVDDHSYHGEKIPFDLKVEHVFQTMDWGKNHYECTCEGKKVSVVVQQSK